jgi:putative transcriptional regulator
MSFKNYTGHLAVANPNNPTDEYEKSVYFIANYNESSVISLRINQINPETDLGTVAHNLGINYPRLDYVYQGGNYSPNKIYVIHSLDWRGIGTVPVTKNIGVTHDISILIALAENDGPKFFKACAGHEQWATETFNYQLTNKKIDGIPHKWEMLPASIDNIFLVDDDLLWEHCIESTIIKKVKDFF